MGEASRKLAANPWGVITQAMVRSIHQGFATICQRNPENKLGYVLMLFYQDQADGQAKCDCRSSMGNEWLPRILREQADLIEAKTKPRAADPAH